MFTKSGRNHINFYINIINWKTELNSMLRPVYSDTTQLNSTQLNSTA